MNAARLSESPRLRRVLEALERNPKGLTTRGLILEANVCAVNSCAAELRANGVPISCSPVPGAKGVYLYRLEEAA